MEEKDISKRNTEREGEEPSNKKQKPDKDNCFDIELMIKQLTTVVRELEKHEFQNVIDAPGENWNGEIDGVIGSMICLVETARYINNIPSEQLVFYEKLRKKTEKQISNKAIHFSLIHTGFYKKYFLSMKTLRDERALQPPP